MVIAGGGGAIVGAIVGAIDYSGGAMTLGRRSFEQKIIAMSS